MNREQRRRVGDRGPSAEYLRERIADLELRQREARHEALLASTVALCDYLEARRIEYARMARLSTDPRNRRIATVAAHNLNATILTVSDFLVGRHYETKGDA